MKKTLVFISCLFLCMVAFSQVPQKSIKSTFPFPSGYNKDSNSFKTVSGLTVKQRLDSILVFGNSSIPGQKNAFQYDNNKNGISDITYLNLNSSGGVSWTLKQKKEGTYNANNQPTMLIYTLWNGTNCDDTVKSIYSYTNNLLTLQIDSEWNNSIGLGWRNKNKEERTYDNNQNISVVSYYSWNVVTSQWQGENKLEYTYNANNNIVSTLEYNWNSTTNQWDMGHKMDFSYDANQNIVLYTEYLWDINQNQWGNFYKRESYYNASGNDTLDIFHFYNAGNWEIANKIEYLYDNQNNVISYTYFSQDLGQWLAETKYEYDFNTSYTRNDLVVPSDYDSYGITPLNSMLTNTRTYYFVDNVWLLDNTATYYYADDFGTAVENPVESTILLYPNPALDFIQMKFPENIQKANLRLSDIQGKMILDIEVTSQQIIPTHMFPSGLYLYQLKTNEKTYNGKLILK